MIRAERFFVGILTNPAVDLINNTVDVIPNNTIVLFSQIDYTSINENKLNKIRSLYDGRDNIYLITSINDYRFIISNRKKPEFTLFCDWLMTTNMFLEIATNKGTKYCVINTSITNERRLSAVKPTENNLEWHTKYDGRFGFAISTHSGSGKDTLYWNYSLSINSNQKFHLQEFDASGRIE